MDLFIRNQTVLLHKVLSEGLESCGLCDVLISCLDSHSDGHPFTAERTAEQAMLFLNSPNLLKQLIRLQLGWPVGECNFSIFMKTII